MTKRRVAILISGGGSNMVALLDSMGGDHPAEPVLVLSNDASAAGLDKARARGVAVASVDHRPFKGDRAAFEAELTKPLLEARADLICLAGFMRVLTEGFVSQWSGRMLNIHPSLLPKYKGLHTHARALAAGDAEHGAPSTPSRRRWMMDRFWGRRVWTSCPRTPPKHWPHVFSSWNISFIRQF